MKCEASIRKWGWVALVPVICSTGARASVRPASAVCDLGQGSGSVEFRATGHPSSLKIIGKGQTPQGRLEVKGRSVLGMASFKLDSLDTGIEMRNQHMKERYLETGKYPEARLTLVQMILPEDIADGKSWDAVPFSGKLLLHGVEKPVTGTARVACKGEQISVAARFGIRIADYRIALPSFAGITMADEVVIEVSDTAPLTPARPSATALNQTSR